MAGPRSEVLTTEQAGLGGIRGQFTKGYDRSFTWVSSYSPSPSNVAVRPKLGLLCGELSTPSPSDLDGRTVKVRRAEGGSE
jgi:hypothetical protein